MGQCLAKLEWVVSEAERQNCDLLIFGGDFCNHPHISIRAVGEALEILSNWPRERLLYVLGQHDTVGHQPSTLVSSSASLLRWAFPNGPGMANDSIYKYSSDESIWLVSHHSDIEKKLTTMGPKRNDPPVLTVAHALVGYTIPFENVVTQSNLLLTGDLHSGYPIQTHNGITMANPGSLMRTSIEQYNQTPQVALFETGEHPTVEYLPITRVDPATIFDLGKHQATKAVEHNRSEYVAMLSRMKAGGQPLTEEALARMELEDEVRKYVEEKLKKAEEQSK